jgi:uncharacterized membrane protein
MALFYLRQTASIGSTILIGLIAGLLLGTDMAMYTARSLPEASWTMRFQLEDALFAKAMPPFFLITLVALSVTAALTEGSARWFFTASALLTLAVLVITVGFEVPINKQIHSWTPGSAPVDWAALRDRWLSNHLIRTIAGVLAFVCSVAGVSWR